MMRRLITTLSCLCLFQTAQAQDDSAITPVPVTSLHPLLGDMVEQIGSSHVKVTNLLKPNGNLHSFEPNPKDISQLSQAKILVASGKNIEPYLKKLEESLSPQTVLVNLGEKIPNVPVVDTLNSEPEHTHGPTCSCSHGPHDPHWWHTPNNMKRAARIITKELIQAQPESKELFQKNLALWNKKMDALDTWAKKELSTIPQNKRFIVTGHAAMNHFCKEYGFTTIAVQGISREDEGTTNRLAQLLKQLREQNIEVIFPEYSSNPKSLNELAKALQIKVAKPLNTDGLSPNAHSFELMFKQNVKAIKEALSDTPDQD